MMKKILAALALLLFSIGSNAQFTNGQVLTAQALNAALGSPTIVGGSINNSPVGQITPAAGTFTNVVVTGTLTAPISIANLSAQAANTVVANVTASLAVPTAVSIPSCSVSNGALKYTSGTGFVCGTTFALTTGNLGQFASTTSAQLFGVMSDPTGSGSLVFGTNPTITGATISGGPGSFTTLAASSTVSGTGFSTYLASPPAIGGTAAAAGTFTTLNSTGGALNGTLGATTPAAATVTTLTASSTVSGTGINSLFASPPAIGSTAQNSGKFTTLQATGAISPASPAGIVGTTTNDNANAGSWGEYQTASGGANSLSNAVTANMTSISLGAGDWDVMCEIAYVPAAGTTISGYTATITTTSGGATSLGFSDATGGVALTNSFGIGIGKSPPARFSFAITTTVFCAGLATFGGGTATGQGFIRARRVR